MADSIGQWHIEKGKRGPTDLFIREEREKEDDERLREIDIKKENQKAHSDFDPDAAG